MRRILALLPLVALLTTMAVGQDAASGQERLEFFNACRPMQLLVENLGDDATDVGLTREMLQAAAESRLRAARLYSEDRESSDGATLYVNINVYRTSYTILPHYRKAVTDAFATTGSAVTWFTGSTGTHGGDAGYIVSALSRHLDEFLAAYLRVNEPACGSPAGRP